MDDMPISPIKKKLLIIGFALTFLYALQLSIPLYSFSRFLSLHFNSKEVTYIYIITAILSIYIINTYNKLLSKYHNYATASTIIIVNIISLLALAFVVNIYAIAFYAILYMSLNLLLAISINLYIQEFSEHHDVGMLRGINLVLSASAFILGLYISKFLLVSEINVPYIQNPYALLYISTTVLLFPMLYIINHYYKHIDEPIYKGGHMWKVLLKLHMNKDLYGVFIANLSLQVFISIMIIYFINYLIDYGHVLLPDYVGIIMPLALLPFVLLPYAIGKLSDRKYGEKEFMIWGLIIMTVSLFIIPAVANYANILMQELSSYINNIKSDSISVYKDNINIITKDNILKDLISTPGSQPLLENMQDAIYRKILFAWGAVLVLGRIGSSILEESSNSYFYKKISNRDSDIISLFNNTSSLGMLIGGLIAICAFYINIYMGINYAIFILTGLFCLYAIYYISKIKDTL